MSGEDGGETEGYCEGLVSPRGLKDNNILSSLMGFVQIGALLGVIAYYRFYRAVARNGEEIAASKLVVPIYGWIIHACIFAFLFQSLASVFITYNAAGANDLTASVLLGLGLGFNHSIIDGITVLLVHKGSGNTAFKRALVIGLFIGIVTFFMTVGVIYDKNTNGEFGMDLLWEGGLTLFYLSFLILPLSVLHRRPALKWYSLFWLSFRTVMIVAKVLLHLDIDAGFCLYYFSSWTVFSILKPIMIYYALYQDTRYWQGDYVGTGEFAFLTRLWQIICPCFCFCGRYSGYFSFGSSKRMAVSHHEIFNEEEEEEHGAINDPEGDWETHMVAQISLTETIEDYEKEGGSILPFGLLWLTKGSFIGPADTIQRCLGYLGKTQVEVKGHYYHDLNPIELRKVLEDAKVLAILDHPNLTKFMGICIAPPSTFAVGEYCGHTLYDFLRKEDSVSLLTWAQELKLMLGVAKGVEFLHAQTPPILHCNIHTKRLLVSNDGIVKINTLDFDGRNRDALEKLLSRERAELRGKNKPKIKAGSKTSINNSDSRVQLTGNTEKEVITLDQLFGKEEMSYGIWTAPEIFEGEMPTEFADCYSLSMVFLQVFTGHVPFENEPRDLRKLITKDKFRPLIPSNAPSNFAELLKEMWSEWPESRPPMSKVVQKLEQMMNRENQEILGKRKSLY